MGARRARGSGPQWSCPAGRAASESSRPDSALASAEPDLAPDVAPNPETLALGLAVAEEQRGRSEVAMRGSQQGCIATAAAGCGAVHGGCASES